jgi:hypothetical protein
MFEFLDPTPAASPRDTRSIDCFSPAGLTLDEVQAIMARAKAISGFVGFAAHTTHTFTCHPAQLPALDGLPGIGGYGHLTLCGALPDARAFTDILQRGEVGWLGVETAFVPVPQGHESDGCDRLGAARWAGRSFFTYTAEGSAAAYDLRARTRILHEIIRAGHLPLRLSAWEGTVNLYHREKRMLRLGDTCGVNGDYPGAFSCELTDPAPVLVRRLQDAIHALAMPGTRAHRWIATTRTPERLTADRATALLRAVRDADLPADAYTCTLRATITDLTGLDALRACLGPGDAVPHCLGQVTLPHDNFAVLDLLARADGFQLRLSPLTRVDTVDLSRRLGVAFT